jgi:hypothetical protein
VEVAGGETVSGDPGVVAAIEPDGVDVVEQTAAGSVVEGWFQQDRVVAVGAIRGPADWYPEPVAQDRPLPSELASIGRVFAGSLPASRAFV